MPDFVYGAEDRLAVLTDREREVVALVGRGTSNDEIEAEAAAGPLKAGPFFSSVLEIPNAQRQAKVWVSSSKPGKGDAVVTVVDPNGADVVSTRPGGDASVENAQQFWPGAFDVPAPAPPGSTSE